MYEKIARYYDALHDGLTADVGYLLTLAHRCDGPILELGCGTGRILLPLARAGFAVVGVDSSPAMLALARARLVMEAAAVQKRVQLHKADMTTLTLDRLGHFALVILPYNTSMHLTQAQLLATLRWVKGSLTENGRLFIDLANPMLVAQTPDEATLTLENSLIDPITGDIVLQFARNRLEPEQQRLHITWIYDASPPQGGAVQRLVTEVTYHYWYPHQLEMLLSEAGLHLEGLYGDYNLEAFNEDSERLLLIAGG